MRTIGAGTGNRTLVFSLEGCCSTIELHPRRGKICPARRRFATTLDHNGRALQAGSPTAIRSHPQSQRQQCTCSEPLFRKGPTGTAFQISFKRKGFFCAGEGKVSLQAPRHKLRCVRDFAIVVLCQTGTKIGCHSDIMSSRNRQTFKNIDVMHQNAQHSVKNQKCLEIVVRLRCCATAARQPSRCGSVVKPAACRAEARRAKAGGGSRTRTCEG